MSQHPAKAPPSGKALAALAFTALGVVYGDIGTSPLYAIKECFTGHHSIDPTPENVIGVLSLIFWSINFIVSFKYIGIVLRADNRGEGGSFALLAQVHPLSRPEGGRRLLIAVGLMGAAMLYGDGVITPAISVLSAIEGATLEAPAVTPHVWPIAAVVLTALFALQKRGTERIGVLFGPVMSVWFVSIAILGVRGILMAPEVLKAINPWYAVDFFIRDGLQAFLILGSVVLVVTGAEALFADMGHFGKRPIRVTWFFAVLPALLINYFGQAALLLVDPAAQVNPFFSLAPAWALYPMVGIATAAAIVACRASLPPTVRSSSASWENWMQDARFIASSPTLLRGAAPRAGPCRPRRRRFPRRGDARRASARDRRARAAWRAAGGDEHERGCAWSARRRGRARAREAAGSVRRGRRARRRA